MFQFRRFPSYTYGFSIWWLVITPAGFLHSEIRGSMPICGSPRLIAAYHVFRRLPVPRHSPCALCSLTADHLYGDLNFQILHLPTKDYSDWWNRRFYFTFTEGFNLSFRSSYSVFKVHHIRLITLPGNEMVGWNGLEPSTSRLSAECSNQLSYQPI